MLDHNYKNKDLLVNAYYDLKFISACLMSTAHWIFASKYFHLAVMLKMIYAQKTFTITQPNEKHINRLFLGSHICFTCLITAAIVSGCIDREPLYAWAILDAICKILPAVILVISVLFLRKLINQIGVGVIQSRQNLISMHTWIFIGLIVTIIAVKLCNIRSYHYRKEGDYQEKCRFDIS